MQTTIASVLANDPRAATAQSILRKCVHCGFCLATCPTYNLLGNELDSPRGRIYLIKQVVEGSPATPTTLQHLDRCLTCRNCETTCPSGVQYGHLLDAGRSLIEDQVSRTIWDVCRRKLVLGVLPYARRVGPLVWLGQKLRPIMPSKLAGSIPRKQDVGYWPEKRHARRMLVLEGCVQPSMTPATNACAARVLDTFGVSLERIRQSGCCGAVHFHLNEQDKAREFMRRNIDAWWPAIEQGCEAILATASGCGVMIKDYAHVLADDADYAEKAGRISELCMDTAQAVESALSGADLSRWHADAAAMGDVAFHPPCTLQHGQKLPLITENLLQRFGFTLTAVQNSHTCCGSAGTYSIFQPELSQSLRKNKVEAVLEHRPANIATANIGCQLHLQSAIDQPVLHWLELVDKLLSGHSEERGSADKPAAEGV